MEKKQNQDRVVSSGQVTECERLEERLRKFQNRLLKVESEKEILYEDQNFKIDHLNALNTEIDQINREITKIKTEQRRMGCFNDTSSFFLDNQTIISTSSVRRKDTKALEKIEHPTETYSNKKK